MYSNNYQGDFKHHLGISETFKNKILTDMRNQLCMVLNQIDGFRKSKL